MATNATRTQQDIVNSVVQASLAKDSTARRAEGWMQPIYPAILLAGNRDMVCRAPSAICTTPLTWTFARPASTMSEFHRSRPRFRREYHRRWSMRFRILL